VHYSNVTSLVELSALSACLSDFLAIMLKDYTRPRDS